jgi:hypothetical protein
MWRDDFATVKRPRDGFGAFLKETGCHTASSRPPQSLAISHVNTRLMLYTLNRIWSSSNEAAEGIIDHSYTEINAEACYRSSGQREREREPKETRRHEVFIQRVSLRARIQVQKSDATPIKSNRPTRHKFAFRLRCPENRLHYRVIVC